MPRAPYNKTQFKNEFVPTNMPARKTTILISEPVIHDLRTIIPESGFVTYYPNYCFMQLLNQLNKKGIIDYATRCELGLTTPTEVLSYIRANR